MSAPLPSEWSEVEEPLIEQLQALGWEYSKGDIDLPSRTERTSFRQVLLRDRVAQALRRLNVDATGQPWLDDAAIERAIFQLAQIGSSSLIEANKQATQLLLEGAFTEGPDGKQQPVRFIAWEPERLHENQFLVINQFRVDGEGAVGGRGFIIPDLVLFVNGIPLVVIEAKSPASTEPLVEAISQLRRYSNQLEGAPRGAERLFRYCQLLVATSYDQARLGTVGASFKHFLAWRDPSLLTPAAVAAQVGRAEASEQALLVAGVLAPARLLDIVRHFTLFAVQERRTIKIVPRYQQYRAVGKILQRLQTGQVGEAETGLADERGGIIWHTQGSGKSLTMVFLLRALRSLPALRRFKVVVITDRTDLQAQLAQTAQLTGEPVYVAPSVAELAARLAQPGAEIVFGTIQKMRGQEDLAGEGGEGETEGLPPALNPSPDILILVDEAHRSHTSALHASLTAALPNAVKLGFTGTPIVAADKKPTEAIFGPFLDLYSIQQSQQDGATVPILYEGRTAAGIVRAGPALDQLFDDLFRDYTPAEQEELRRKWATEGAVQEAPKLIGAKARDMLRHYVAHVPPGGFKAQVVATSRLAAVRYQAALVKAQAALLAALEALDPRLATADEEALAELDEETRFLARVYPRRERIACLEFAAVISADRNRDPGEWEQWSDKVRHTTYIQRFKEPLEKDGLAFLIVKSMLLTGFDAPPEQVLYLDRRMVGHELLQAIARVNRTYGGKTHGLVVDYFGVTHYLKAALAAYEAQDVAGALVPLADELPRLRDRHQHACDFFTEAGLDPTDSEACVQFLRDEGRRHEFARRLREFTASLDAILPRPEGLPYVRDAKRLGFIRQRAANRYRDPGLHLVEAGEKVRALIDEHIEARGIDPTVPPVDILAADFAAQVEAQGDYSARASEMEFALRHHITEHYREDPIYYRKLSQRLEELLARHALRWEELVAALAELTETVRAGATPDETGLDPQVQVPFLRTLAARAEGATLAQLAPLTVAVVALIQAEVRLVGFWDKPHGQAALRGKLISLIDEHDVVPFAEAEPLADELVQQARALHTKLVRDDAAND